jgi:hypothetical protein
MLAKYSGLHYWRSCCIGRVIVETFALEGAHLALIDLNAAGLKEPCFDLRAEQGVRQGMLAALAPYEGVIDILVPNVGGSFLAHSKTFPASSDRRPLRSTSSRSCTPAVWRCR